MLLGRYKSLVRSKARSYFLIGGETEDLVQEGMIGLFDAITDYDPDKGASFSTFAELCVSRQIFTALQISTRKKNTPLNEALSLDAMNSVGGTDEELSGPSEETPEEMLVSRENVNSLFGECMELLSPFEKTVLEQMVAGEDYLTIAENTGREPKSVDNAIQRIRNKIRRYLKTREA